MITSFSTSPSPTSGLARTVQLLTACAAFAASGFAAEPKSYTLFLGTDISVQRDKEFHRVQDVTGGNFTIKVGNEEVLVPMRTGAGTLKVDQGFKLTATAARLEKLKTERAYSPENDPYAKWGAKAGTAHAADASQVIAARGPDIASVERITAEHESLDANRLGDPGRIAAAQDRVMWADIQINRAGQRLDNANYQMAFSDFNNPGNDALDLQRALAEENFDAMRYSFEVSSDTPLNRPYLVFIVRYHEKDAQPGTGQGTIIYAKSIAPIGAQPSKINILQTGLPLGFIADETQVRLYNNGREVATNVAPRRMEMTKDEAFLYLKVDRVGRAKGASLPAAPAIGRLDEAARARLTNDQLRNPYFVKVTKDGRAEGVFVDQDCTRAADAIVTELVGEMRFFPALQNGKEQPGVAKLLLPQVQI